MQAIGYYDSDGVLMTGITAVNASVSAISGVTLSAAVINKLIYGSASRCLQCTTVSVYDTLALTCVTALGLTAVSQVWATPASGGTCIFLNVWATQATAITFKAWLMAGSAVTAGTAQPINLFALGTPV